MLQANVRVLLRYVEKMTARSTKESTYMNCLTFWRQRSAAQNCYPKIVCNRGNVTLSRR